MSRLKGLYILDEASFPLIYGPAERRAIEQHVDMIAPPQSRQSILQNMKLLESVEVIFSGWGAPKLDQRFMACAPKFKAFFYGAGSVGYCLTDAFWDRDITITSSITANSIPVAEFTLANILLSLKQNWRLARETREQRAFVPRDHAFGRMIPGNFGSTVGLISLGSISRILIKLLKPFDLEIVAYDPFVSPGEAREMGVQLVSFPELFARADVVSVHTPVLNETRGMITGVHLASMKSGSTFINTARGEIVREPEMIEVAQQRPDLQFILDVTDPEPPLPHSPLFTLPNVILTPHIAGSAGGECRRMGRYMAEELERYLAGEPLKWPVPKPIRSNNSVTVSTFLKPAMKKPTVINT